MTAAIARDELVRVGVLDNPGDGEWPGPNGWPYGPNIECQAWMRRPLVDWATAQGYRLAWPRLRCLHWVAGYARRCASQRDEYGHRGIASSITHNAFDHVTCWTKDGKPAALLAQPYDLYGRNGDGRAELEALADEFGLTVEITKPSPWYGPATFGVIFRPTGKAGGTVTERRKLTAAEEAKLATVRRRRPLTARGLVTVPMPRGGRGAFESYRDLAVDPPNRDFVRETPCDIGILVGMTGMFVLDGDTEGAVEELFRDLDLELPSTYRVKTRRGWHFYFWSPTGEAPRTADLRAQGYDIDVKGKAATGTSALVPAAGNQHHADPSVIYTAEDPDAEILPAPADLIDWLAAWRRIEQTDADVSAVAAEAEADDERLFTAEQAERYIEDFALAPLRAAAEGDRNAQLNRSAVVLGHFVPEFATASEARARLRETAEEVGLGDDEIGSTIASGLTRGMAEPYGREPDPFVDLVAEVEPAPEPEPEPDVPGPVADAALWSARPELATILEVARRQMVGPYALLGAVLVHVAGFTGPHVQLPATVGGRAALNVLIGLVGRSGGGKGIAWKVARELIDPENMIATAPDGRPLEVPLGVLGTGQGIAARYTQVAQKSGGLPKQICDSAIFTLDEIDSLAAHAGMGGANVLPVLRTAWDGSALGEDYAAFDKRRPVGAYRYRFALYAGIQPARSKCLLDERVADAGTPQRWVWLPVTDPGAPELAEAADPLAGFMAAGTLWRPRRDFLPSGLRSFDEGLPEAPPRVELDVCDTAARAIRRSRWLENSGREVPPELDGHALLTQLKIAALLGILNRSDGKVSDEDWELAGQLRAVSDATRQVCRDALAVADNRDAAKRGETRAQEDDARDGVKTQQAVAAVLRRLGREAGAWVAGGEVSRAVAGRLRRDHLAPAVELLVQTGQIEVEQTDGKRGAGTRVRLKS